jgi:hypothetical protein
MSPKSESEQFVPPSDHHIFADGTIFRTDRQRELLAQLESQDPGEPVKYREPAHVKHEEKLQDIERAQEEAFLALHAPEPKPEQEP